MTTSDETYIIAVDGGGSTCRAVVSTRAGHIIGSARGGPANLGTCFATTLLSVKDTVARAYQAAGLPVDRIGSDFGILGLAGASVGDRARRFKTHMAFGKTIVTTDREITVQGALGDGDGTVALVGTGSFFVNRRGGKTRKIGGWGFVLGDEAGGAWLGRQALGKTLQAHDGVIPHTPLTRDLLSQFSGDPIEIVMFANSSTPREFGMLAPLIVAALESDDPTARAIFDDGVSAICRALAALGFKDGRLVMLGGLGPVYQKLMPANCGAYCVPAHGDALTGAIELAQAAMEKGTR